MDTQSCLICNRIAAIQAGTNSYFVAETNTGYVVLGDYQFFRGYTLLLHKHHVLELHELVPSVRQRFLYEMSLVAEAVFHAFRPRKLNYELLGNAEPHLHWHIFPRHFDDPSPNTSSWKVDKALRYGEAAKPTTTELDMLKHRLLDALVQTQDITIQNTWQS